MKDEKRQRDKKSANKCYQSFKRNGRNSCSGCNLDYVCQMPRDATKWLFETFLPAIDPTGTTFHIKKGGT